MGVEELSAALQPYRLLFLDTMVFSYHLGDHPVYASLTALILRRVEQNVVSALTTTVTLAEVLTRPAQVGNRDAVADYRLYLANFPNLRIVPLDLALAERVAWVRAETRLRMPDAVQIAAAQLHGADCIITNDRAWAGRFAAPALLVLDDYR